MAVRRERDRGPNARRRNRDPAPRGGALVDYTSDDEFQAAMLEGVSRTFALTIPQLPRVLGRVVANAYLLCRIVDTIEDEPALSSRQKAGFYRRFVKSLSDPQSAERLSEELCPLLSCATIAAEQDLMRHVPRVVRITRSFPDPQRESMERCVRVMAEGMGEFQARGELQTSEDLDQYCYYVAGVVGEMLTRLFCLYSPDINRRYDGLMMRAVSFGQGLQMTNILKDVWEDYQRGACWLPREIFAEEGFDLHELAQSGNRGGFERGIHRLIAVAHRHLKNALAYTLLIPRQETGIRKFCLWAIGFALLTLRKIHQHPEYRQGNEVKVSRLSVKGTMLLSRFAAQHDAMLNGLFLVASRSLPLGPPSLGWSPPKVAHGSRVQFQTSVGSRS
ncbi:MAG TPA: phytoene/squalene synthase family protein [Terriglobales bacterium]|nr:phytoene/squalene synthase family protein [Terriglobales bacterium]